MTAVGLPYYGIDSQLDGASVIATWTGRFDESSVSMEAVAEFNVQTSAVPA
ncbi:MAG: hypothetical protein L0387_21130 [Acidobacteria bacterium]|nr:hypothetical protein [Acidobacteriota bacterium]